MSPTERDVRYSGLLQALRQYDAVVPGSAQEIIKSNVADPNKRQNELTNAAMAVAKRGQWIASGIVAVCISAAILFFFSGNNIAGAIFFGGTLPMLIKQFWSGGQGDTNDE
jgi:hypothetical protein